MKNKLAYIPDYSLDIASKLIAGADVWVNTPERGKEACGTSGMKAALNGALMCSISDGWMDEVDWSSRVGFCRKRKRLKSLYDFLEKEIAPEFLRRGEDAAAQCWISRMRKTISIVERGFGSRQNARGLSSEDVSFLSFLCKIKPMNLFKSSSVGKLKILFVAAEAAPFASVGGLASVMYSLPKALSRLGHDARVFMPRYVFIDDSKNEIKMEKRGLQVPTGSENCDSKHLVCNVKRRDENIKDPKSPVTTYFLENQEYFELRTNVYGYSDDTIRWALLSRGVLEFISYWSEWKPDIIVSSDWQTGLVSKLYEDFVQRRPGNFQNHFRFFHSQSLFSGDVRPQVRFRNGQTTTARARFPPSSATAE